MNDSFLREALALTSAGGNAKMAWDESDYGSILAHFLRSNVQEIASSLNPVLAEQSAHVAFGRDADLTFERLLVTDPAAPMPLLRLVKDIAKACLSFREIGIPHQVSSVLYYTAVCTALVYHNCWITSLLRDAIRDGLISALSFTWIDDRIRVLFLQCLDLLSSEES